jgi:hypothetical protein
MRRILISAGLAWVVLGCRQVDPPPEDPVAAFAPKTRKTPIRRATSRSQAAPASAPTTPLVLPQVVPAADLSGRIAAVNEPGRFVVVEFPLEQIPASGQRLSVYRQSVKVGELKITGPARGSNIAADLLAGEARMGDVVRLD